MQLQSTNAVLVSLHTYCNSYNRSLTLRGTHIVCNKPGSVALWLQKLQPVCSKQGCLIVICSSWPNHTSDTELAQRHAHKLRPVFDPLCLSGTNMFLKLQCRHGGRLQHVQFQQSGRSICNTRPACSTLALAHICVTRCSVTIVFTIHWYR